MQSFIPPGMNIFQSHILLLEEHNLPESCLIIISFCNGLNKEEVIGNHNILIIPTSEVQEPASIDSLIGLHQIYILKNIQ